MSLADCVMLFLGDTFFSAKLKKEVFQGLILTTCVSYWQNHTQKCFHMYL